MNSRKSAGSRNPALKCSRRTLRKSWKAPRAGMTTAKAVQVALDAPSLRISGLNDALPGRADLLELGADLC